MRLICLAALCLALAACMPAPGAYETATRAAPVSAGMALPPMKVFASPRTQAPRRSNAQIARDFLDLSFQLESGRGLPVFTRFSEPVTVRVTGQPTQTLNSDLARLLLRLRREADITITQVQSGPANITIQAIPRADIRAQVPMAACFVVPNVSSLGEYKLARRTPLVNWTQLRQRRKLAIFVPSDASPQEIRDCLHEELAQALGPLNDLYRLSDSVFNDDNVHTVLTGFDMLILRAYYDPALRNGMSRQEVARALPAILARINPAGEIAPAAPPRPTTRDWILAIQTAMGPGAGSAARIRAARQAVAIAEANGWTGTRRAFAHYALGRLTLGTDAGTSYRAFRAADRFYAAAPDAALHRAYVATQLAAFSLSAGDAAGTLDLVTPYLQTAISHENAALLSTLMMLRAEALMLAGRATDARQVRLDSLGWARYGFGSEQAVRARLREIAALSPL